jgi:hypothetical protein
MRDEGTAVRCVECDGELSGPYRYCPWCAAPQRSKIVEYFRGHPLIERDPIGLRVSRYLDDDNRHVRLSIWDGEQAVAAIALAEHESRRLAAFLAARPESRRALGLSRRLSSSLAALSRRR